MFSNTNDQNWIKALPSLADATFGAKDKRYKDKTMPYVSSISYPLAKEVLVKLLFSRYDGCIFQ